MQKALVLFSGGQDSTTSLAWALSQFDLVETIGFDYGQRHAVELSCRDEVVKRIKKDFPDWSPKLGDDYILKVPSIHELSDSSLTRESEIHMQENGLPSTFVPGRNLLFFTYAAAYAYRRGIHTLVGGMCETDFSGYPDCRNDVIQNLAETIRTGMAFPQLQILTPLMSIDKAETWRLAEKLGGIEFVKLIVEETHTCYSGDRTTLHPWGYGCAQCPACVLRKKGFETYIKRFEITV